MKRIARVLAILLILSCIVAAADGRVASARHVFLD